MSEKHPMDEATDCARALLVALDRAWEHRESGDFKREAQLNLLRNQIERAAEHEALCDWSMDTKG